MSAANFTREELIDLRDRSLAMSRLPCANPNWNRAFEDLAAAADRLDAMFARAALQTVEQKQQPTRPSWPSGPVDVPGSGG